MITPTDDNTFSPHQKKKKEKNLPTFIPSIASSSRFYLAEKSPINRGYSTPFKFNRKTEREITILPYTARVYHHALLIIHAEWISQVLRWDTANVWLRARLWPEEGWKRRGACITMRGDRGSPAVYHVSWQEAAHDGEERARKRYARSSSEPHEPARPYARRRAPAIAAPLIAKTAGNCDVLLLCAGRITVIRNLFLFSFFVSKRVLRPR